ncbi:MAG: hypothetical protein AB1646_16885 [Thermodesulfobacteriota bacterium]
MRTLVFSLVIAALLIGTGLVAAPTVQAGESGYPDTELIICKLAFPGYDQPMTRLACQNAGGKELRSGDESGRGK